MSSKRPEVHNFRNDAGGGPRHSHGQHAQKFGKDRAYGSGDILADKQTDPRAHTDVLMYSS